jgi:hypothetical protein
MYMKLNLVSEVDIHDLQACRAEDCMLPLPRQTLQLLQLL